ncbi:hypothetical protein RUND412_001363 [Rhizina undulata]
MAEEKYDFRRLRPRSARSAASQSFYSQRHISVEQLEGGAAASEVVSIEAASHSPPSLYSSEEKQESGSGKGVAGILGNGMVIMGDGQRTSAAIAAQTPERSEPPRQTSSSSTPESRIKARERKRPIAKKSGGVTKPKKKKKNNKKIIPRRSSSTSIIDMPPSRTSTRRSFPLRNKASVVAIKIFALDAATYFSHIPIHELTPEARVTLWRTFLVTPMGEMRVSDFMATFGTLSEEEKRGLNEKIEEVVGEIYGCVERGVSDAGKVWEEVRRVYSWEE